MVALAACSARRTINAYPGPERPAAEVATVTVARPSPFGANARMDEKITLYIVGVDGVKVAQKSIFRELIVTALVTPGRHSVTFGFYDTFSNSITPRRWSSMQAPAPPTSCTLPMHRSR